MRKLEEEYGIYKDEIVNLRNKLRGSLKNIFNKIGLTNIEVTKDLNYCTFYFSEQGRAGKIVEKMKIPTITLLRSINSCKNNKEIKARFSFDMDEEQFNVLKKMRTLIDIKKIKFSLDTLQSLEKNDKFYKITSQNPHEIARICKKGVMLQYLIPESNISFEKLQSLLDSEDDILDLCKPITFMEILKDEEDNLKPSDYYYGVKPSNFDNFASFVFQTSNEQN